MIDTLARYKDGLSTSPLSVAFNAAVKTLANHANPRGWKIEDSYLKAPSSLADLNASINTDGVIKVWAGASSNTIFGDAEHNHAFRAWHDALHWKHQLPFNVAGEAGVAYVQVQQLVRKYGIDEEVIEFAAAILTEVIGQALARTMNGEYPSNQRVFFDVNYPKYLALAERLVYEINEDMTERQAIGLASQTWGRA